MLISISFIFLRCAFTSSPPRVKKLCFFTEIQPLNFLTKSFLFRKPGVRGISFVHASEESSRTVVEGALEVEDERLCPGRTAPPRPRSAPRRPAPARRPAPPYRAPLRPAHGKSGFWIRQVEPIGAIRRRTIGQQPKTKSGRRLARQLLVSRSSSACRVPWFPDMPFMKGCTKTIRPISDLRLR